jgi:serine/threonine protein kinase
MIRKRPGPSRIFDKLDTGGMGEVYRARKTQLNREVALKVLPADFASGPWSLKFNFYGEGSTTPAVEK